VEETESDRVFVWDWNDDDPVLGDFLVLQQIGEEATMLS
jgi:hypothetical protein